MVSLVTDMVRLLLLLLSTSGQAALARLVSHRTSQSVSYNILQGGGHFYKRIDGLSQDEFLTTKEAH
jgi:hypothetical protein